MICYATANVCFGPRPIPWSPFAEYWKTQPGTSGLAVSRFACDHLCRVEPTQPASGRLHHDPLPWPESAGTRESTPRGPLATLSNHSGRRARSPGRVCREWVKLSTAKRRTVRQLIVTGLGHESPTFFLTNDRPQPQTAREVIQTYATRNHAENQLGEQITFFHLDCLCSEVPECGLRPHADRAGRSAVPHPGLIGQRPRRRVRPRCFGSLSIPRA